MKYALSKAKENSRWIEQGRTQDFRLGGGLNGTEGERSEPKILGGPGVLPRENFCLYNPLDWLKMQPKWVHKY